MQIIYGSIIEIIADEGKLLTNDGINYSDHLYLGKNDSPDNWYEEEAPQENEQLFREDNIPFSI